jgi:flavin-dependent dehydrogenase
MRHTEPMFGWRQMKVRGRRGGLIPCGGSLRRIAAPGVLLIGDAAGWVSPMTGGGIRLAFRYGRRAASLIADHLINGGAPPERALAREVPRFRAKRLMRRALDFAPPNALLNRALATRPARAIAERVYFHRRNDAAIDREAYVRWIEEQTRPSRLPPVSAGPIAGKSC